MGKYLHLTLPATFLPLHLHPPATPPRHPHVVILQGEALPLALWCLQRPQTATATGATEAVKPASHHPPPTTHRRVELAMKGRAWVQCWPECWPEYIPWVP